MPLRILSLCLLLLASISGVCAQPAKTGKLMVSVLDSLTKQPVPKASITLQNRDYGKVPRTGQADDRGIWESAALDPGEYFLDAHAIGSGYRNDEALPNFSIEAGQSYTQTILLTPDGIIEGTITDQEGVPLKDIRVEALATANVHGTRRFNSVLTVFTNERGQYQLRTIPPGHYFVKASQPSFNSSPRPQAFAATYYPAGDSREQAIRVDVRPASTTMRIDFRLRPVPAFHIEGRVSGLIPGGAEVFTIRSCPASLPTEPSSPDRVSLQRDGSFHIQGVTPGTYCVDLLFRSVAGNRSFMGSQIVTIVDKDLDNVRITLSAPLDVTGAVKGSSSKPQRILLEPAKPILDQTSEVSIDEKTGEFLFSRMPQEDYQLHIYPLVGYQVKSMKYGSREIVDGKFPLAGEAAPLIIEIVEARGQLRGRVSYGTRFPIDGIDVSVLREGVPDYESGPWHADVDEQGIFHFTGLPPGSYRISAFEGSTSKSVIELLDLPEFLRQFPGAQVKVSDDRESTIDIRMISSKEIARAKAIF